MPKTKKKEFSRSLSYQSWQRMRRDKLALFGMAMVGVTIILALLGPNITPDSSPNASMVISELRELPPGEKVNFLLVKKNIDKAEDGIFHKIWFGRVSEYEYKPYDSLFFDGSKVMYTPFSVEGEVKSQPIPVSLADAVFALDDTRPLTFDSIQKVFSIYERGNPDKIVISQQELIKNVEENNLVSRRFYLGTDLLGRDMLSRLMLGTRVSLAVGLVSVIISVFIGLVLGAVAGYFRGWVDDVIMWVINVVWSIPTLLLVIAITLALGKGMVQVFIAVGLTMWVDVARVVRGQTLSLREKEFVEAGKALGFTNYRIIFQHVLPNVMGPVIVICAANFANAILIEAGLSFLGIGAQPPTASWGAMVNDHRQFLFTDSSYLAIVPGLAIMVLVLAFMLVGNGLRDSIDTKAIDEDQVMGY